MRQQHRSKSLTRAVIPSRLPRHIGFIPDGNRRWASGKGLSREAGYASGIEPGLELFDICNNLKIEEVSVYGFTQDNTKRPGAQTKKFREACVLMAERLADGGSSLLVLGDDTSAQFPESLKRFRTRQGRGLKVNLLINYGWQWDLDGLRTGELRSHEVSRIDLIVRWGGGCRLSGFLPAQSVYADIFVLDAFWPDFEKAHLDQALQWFARQDRTLGG